MYMAYTLRLSQRAMPELPDELWRKILDTGLQQQPSNSNDRLTYKDLCCLSITSRRLGRLSNEDSLWSSLLSFDFPIRLASNTDNSPPKELYRTWYEKDKERRLLAHKRAVLRIESRVAEHCRRLRELGDQRVEEGKKIEGVVAELSHLHKVRQASAALNVWQPEVIRGRQKQIVEQCSVPVDSRINALEMELRLCKQQIIVFEKAYRDEKRRLGEAKEQLSSMKYHPLQDSSVIESGLGDHSSSRKKLKRSSTVSDHQSEKS